MSNTKWTHAANTTNAGNLILNTFCTLNKSPLSSGPGHIVVNNKLVSNVSVAASRLAIITCGNDGISDERDSVRFTEVY